MKSAVVLAGYNNRRAVEHYSHLVKKSYGEKFIETGYKPLREFPFSLYGQYLTKPLIQFTLPWKIIAQKDPLPDEAVDSFGIDRKKNLSLKECEGISTQFLKGKVRMLPIAGLETTFDYDGTKKELKKISRML